MVSNFNKEHVRIDVSNRCSEPVDFIIRKANRPLKWDSLIEVGGQVEYLASPENEITVQITIPFAGFCGEEI